MDRMPQRMQLARHMHLHMRPMAAGSAGGQKFGEPGRLHYTYERSEMTKYKLEYIWLDGYTPVPNLRVKKQIK